MILGWDILRGWFQYQSSKYQNSWRLIETEKTSYLPPACKQKLRNKTKLETRLISFIIIQPNEWIKRTMLSSLNFSLLWQQVSGFSDFCFFHSSRDKYRLKAVKKTCDHDQVFRFYGTDFLRRIRNGHCGEERPFKTSVNKVVTCYSVQSLSWTLFTI